MGTDEVHSINTWILLPIIVMLDHRAPIVQSSPIHSWQFLGCLAFYQTASVPAVEGLFEPLWWPTWALAILNWAPSSALLFPLLFFPARDSSVLAQRLPFYFLLAVPSNPISSEQIKSSVNKFGWKTRCLQFPASVQVIRTLYFSLV